MIVSERTQLKNFCLNALIIGCLVFAVLTGIEVLSLDENYKYLISDFTGGSEFLKGNSGPDEIIPFIDKVRAEDDTTKLIIGDSV